MSAFKNTKIVNLEDFGQTQRGLGSRAVTQALRGTRELATSRLAEYLGRMMEKIDDALFARAEKAESNMAQTVYFDAMRELRIIRKDIEEDFLARFHNQFDQGVPRKDPLRTSITLNWEDHDENGLGLVEKNDMEETLAITNMVTKVRGNCKQSLYSLDKRIGFLINDPDLEDWTNPLGPEAICEAFHQAAKLIQNGLEIRLVIFKLFDQHVISCMEELYKEVNQYLARIGVLPEIKTTLRNNGSLIDGLRRLTRASPTAPENSTTASSLNAPPEPTGHGVSTRSDNNGVSSTYYAYDQSPIHALTFLQQGSLPPSAQDTRHGELAVSAEDLGSGQVNVLHAIKDSALIREFGKSGNTTIDMVAMLFDYILDDRNIPDIMRALIGRLQIPVLKVALLDREFFAKKSHPTRKLLNSLATIALGWSQQQGDVDDPLYMKVQSIVQTVVAEFDDDLSLFERLLEDLEGFRRREQEQELIRAERSARVMEGQERLEIAEHTTLEEIEPHINDRQSLDFVREFISSHWKNLLFSTCAREGTNSDAWRQAVKTMDELIWSVKPKCTREERQQLVALQPKLLKELREGMERLSLPSSERDDFLAKLVRAHGRTAVNKKDPDPAAATGQQADDAEGAAAVKEEAEHPADTRAPATPKKTQPDRTAAVAEAVDAYTTEAKQLASGDWLEFLDDDGIAQRAKLSWVSPITNTYLFTDRQGLKAGDFSVNELAHLLRCGRARLLNVAPLMDRAVSTVLKEYQQH